MKTASYARRRGVFGALAGHGLDSEASRRRIPFVYQLMVFACDLRRLLRVGCHAR